jgi:hypothetical protein
MTKNEVVLSLGEAFVDEMKQHHIPDIHRFFDYLLYFKEDQYKKGYVINPVSRHPVCESKKEHATPRQYAAPLSIPSLLD